MTFKKRALLLIFTLLSFIISGQTLTGVVTDINNVPLVGVNVFNEVKDGITFANQYNEEHQLEDEVIIIGGAQIFNETLPIMNRLVLTQVDCEIAGDVFYPEIDMHNFSKKNVSKHLKDEKNQFDFSIDLYEKI